MLEKGVGWRASGAAVLILCLLASTGTAVALTDEEIFRDFRFNFINAGPRALGMGGAFVGVADDVTGAHANPGGLTTLDSPEFFGEFRVIDDDPRTFSGTSGSLDVDPVTGARELPFLGVTSFTEPESVEEATFVGVAWPLRLGTGGERRLTLVGSRQVVLSEDRALSSGSGATEGRFAFEGFPNTVSGGAVEAYSVATAVRGESSMKIVYWSLGASLEVHPDFSFGYTLAYATLDARADTVTEIIDPLELFVDPGHPRLPAQPTSDLFATTIDDTDDGFAWSVGIYWHPDSVFATGVSPWRFGAVFRKGAEFSVLESTELNGTPDETFTNKLVVPDRFALGASYRPAQGWLLAGELERIEYSDLIDGFRTGVNYLTSGRVADGGFGVDPEAEITFDVDDGWVPRLGAEYRWSPGSSSRHGAALRAGVYRMPDDRIRMTTFNSDDPGVNDVYLEAFGEGEESDHFTAGFGYTVGRSTIEIAGDFGDDGDQIVGSYTFRWEKR